MERSFKLKKKFTFHILIKTIIIFIVITVILIKMFCKLIIVITIAKIFMTTMVL